MGTRGLAGFVSNGEIKATYNHFDSYPSGLGAQVLHFARAVADNLPELREKVAALRLVNSSESPTDAEREQYAAYSDGAVSTGSDWYAALRNLQGDLAGTLDAGIMVQSSTFGEDSLFCEWGYLVNLDTETLDMYRGFQTSPHKDGLWATAPEERGYYGIRLINSYPLSDLPTDDVWEAVDSEDEEE